MKATRAPVSAYRFIALVFLLGADARLFAQPAPLEAFDGYVTKAVQQWTIPGLAVAVVKDGRLVFAKGYGVRERGKVDPVDPHTLFAIGSTTKAMTAAAIGMLVDEGKLQWNDPVIKYLPSLQLYDPYVTREVTIRDLLTHRSGVGNADFLWYGAENSTQEILRRLRYVKPETSLRSHFTYQNIMYAAAGEVVTAVSGMPWAAFIQARILDPLGMSETLPTAATLSQHPNVASPHYQIRDQVRVIRNASVDAVAPAGAIWSSVSDMSRWMQFILDGGRVGGPAGRRLLSEASYAELFAPQVIVGRDAFYPTAKVTHPHWTTYGLGWFQEDYAGRAVDFHTGSIDGMVAIIGLIRDERLGIYVLANLDHAEARHALMYRVFDLYGGNRSRDWSTELLSLYQGLREEADAAAKKIEQEQVKGTQPSLALEKYAGTYSDPLYGDVTVTFNGALQVKYGSGFSGPLEHWNYDTFRARWEAEWLGTSLASFSLDRRGVPAVLELNGTQFHRVEKPDRAPSQ